MNYTYKISGNEGLKLITDCAGWFGKNADIMAFIQWLAGRCNARTLSANVKMDAAAEFLTTYLDITNGFNWPKEKTTPETVPI